MTQHLDTLIVIPARLASTRLPRKPLAMIGGKTLIERVWRQARKAKGVSKVVIATDSQEIADVATAFDAQVVMTSPTCRTGSDRVAEVTAQFAAQGTTFKAVANVQGDMPFIHPEVIEGTISLLHHSPQEFGMATVCVPILDLHEYERPSAVKVAIGEQNRALYFSRAPIPFLRDGFPGTASEHAPFGWKHLGLYAFRPETLHRLASLPEAEVERREKLEQLRLLAAGIPIAVFTAQPELLTFQVEVDTPEDLARANALSVGADAYFGR